ncbi:hypothetical protein LZ31DRAFT_269695 [Colletotrichum somersetense]|nr:hypothetical protein LZ31DRAFT_269695 [Colletotrichum somersetense]
MECRLTGSWGGNAARYRGRTHPPREPWEAGVLAELSCMAREAPSLMDLNPKGAHSLCATHVSLFSLSLSLSLSIPLDFTDTCSGALTVRIRLLLGISLAEPESYCTLCVIPTWLSSL